MKKLSHNSTTLAYSPELLRLPSTALVNAACRKDFVSFVRKCFHWLAPSGNLSYELAYMRNRASA